MAHAVVHVGPPKTGTTHLQAFLGANNAAFLQHNWTYPYLFEAACRQLVQRNESKNGRELHLMLEFAHDSKDTWQFRGFRTQQAAFIQANVAKMVSQCSSLAHFNATNDQGRARLVRDWWARKFVSIPPRNMIISDEGFGASHDLFAHFLGKALRAAGFSKLIAVAMHRTPVLEMARSVYNQNFAGPGASYRLMDEKRYFLFDHKLAAKYAAEALSQYNGIVHDYAKAGFEVVLVDLAGSAAAGLDEADVVACQVMGMPCTAEGRWAGGSAHKEEGRYSNTRAAVPILGPQLVAAFNRWRDASGTRCAPGMMTPNSTISFVQELERKVSPLLGEHGQPPQYRCQDYADIERAMQKQQDAMLARASRVLHRRTPRPVGEMRFCSLNITHVIALPPVAHVFFEMCSGPDPPE